ncbi:MAG: dihydroorotase [Campylobacteraceae bacterium]|nr:dihydroorotase [Campylobacteraceae bacterium]
MELILDSPLDMHLHLREGAMLKSVAPWSAKHFSGAVVMPNLVPPITSIESLRAYKKNILNVCENFDFTPYMTLFFKADYSKEFLRQNFDEIIALKLYPSGITTNSEGGVKSMDLKTLSPVLSAMSDLGIPLCVHGESDGFVMDREKEFGEVYVKLATAFPDLKIIMEHITTAHSVDLLERYENLYATITLHHLYITLDDVAGGMLNPHLFCKPIAKRPEDKEALLSVALKAHPKVMFGSDSAPHPTSAKESCGCAAGVFTAPIALPALAQLFENEGSLENLQAFVSDNAQRIYDIKPHKKSISLVKKPMRVPPNYEGIVSMFAGEELLWNFGEL